jgi:hypothetical protein
VEGGVCGVIWVRCFVGEVHVGWRSWRGSIE